MVRRERRPVGLEELLHIPQLGLGPAAWAGLAGGPIGPGRLVAVTVGCNRVAGESVHGGPAPGGQLAGFEGAWNKFIKNAISFEVIHLKASTHVN